MGGEFNARVFQTDDSSEVKKEFDRWVADARYERGHGPYTGSIGEKDGLRFSGVGPFKNVDEAEEYLINNNEKWGPAEAVRFVTNERLTTASANAKKRLNDAILKAKANLEALKKKFDDDLRKSKSAFRSCKKCSSKIAKKYIKDDCQVCGESMISATQSSRIRKAEQKVYDAQANMRKWQPKMTKGKSVNYLVGGWCSS